MYQITVSVDSAKAEWLYSIDDVIRNKLSDCFAVSALDISGRRLYYSFGCEAQSKARMLAVIKECLVDMYGVVCKFDFIKRNLSINLPQMNYELLLHTLVAFDRENERKLLNKIVHVEDGMTIEICNLTRNNGAYLYDDETYNELLRFLISAVNPKINKLTVCETEGKYRLTGSLKNSVLDLDVGNSSELMYCLVDLAPLELVIDGRISNRELSKRLIGIFDAKTLNTIKNKK